MTANQRPIPVDEVLQAAHDELIYKRNLTLVMRSKNYCSNSFKVGDSVQVFFKDGKSKRGKWLSPRNIKNIETETVTVTVPGLSGKNICATVEDILPARYENELSAVI